MCMFSTQTGKTRSTRPDIKLSERLTPLAIIGAQLKGILKVL